MPDIEMPNGDIVSFPDDMPKEQIRNLISQKFPNETKELTKSPIADFAKENIARPLLRTARAGLSGIASISDPVNMALGLPLASEQVKMGVDKLTSGLTTPRNKTEKIVDTASELFTGGGAIGVAAKLAKPVSKIGKGIKEFLAIDNTQKLGALTGSSIGVPVAQEVGQKALDLASISPESKLRTAVDVGTGLAGGVFGGVAGAKSTNIPVNLKNWKIKSSLPEAQVGVSNKLGRAKVANQIIKDIETKGISPEEIDLELSSDAGIGLSPIDVSKSNINNIQDLAQIAASRKILKNSFDAREKQIIKAQNDILKGVKPDENALKELSAGYIDKLKTKMQTNAAPLYEKAFENAKFKTIPYQSKIINQDGQEIVLETLLSRPNIKEALKKSKLAALNAQGTSAEKFYQKATPGLKDSNPIVLHNLQSYLRRNKGNFDTLLPNAEESTLMAQRGDILQFLDESLPGYKDARSIYSADVEDLITAQKGTKGAIADLQADKGIDAINKLYRLSPNEIKKVKSELIAINPKKYSEAVKSFIDTKIATLKEGDTIKTIIKNPQDRNKLEALFPNKQTFQGFEKAINYIEKTKPVQDALKKALDQEIRSVPLSESIAEPVGALGGIKRGAGRVFIQPFANKVSDAIKPNFVLQEGFSTPSIKSVDVKQAETMARYAFTDEGRELFRQLAKTNKKADIDKLMTQIYLQSGFLTTLSNSKEE